MKEEYKKLLKVLGCWFLVPLIGVFIGQLLNGFDNLHDWGGLLLVAISFIATPILFCIVFAPALIALWFIYKKTNNIKWRIFWFSFLIPFNNLIYYYIEKAIEPLYKPYTSMLIGASVLFFILPFVGIFSLFTPKKFLPQKYIMVLTSVITFFAGFAMMYFGITVVNHIAEKIFPDIHFTYYNKGRIEALKEYDPVIKYVEDNKACPDKKRLKELDIECISRNNGNDIVLRKYFKDTIGEYYYCTDKTAKECKIGYDEYSNVTKKMGKWFITYYDD